MIRSLNFLESSLRTPRVVIALALSILAIYLAPLFIYGENLYYMHFDNLDSNVVWFKILAESGKIFADSNAIIPNMMGGLPRHTYGSEFNIILWQFYFFPPFTAYMINEVLMHVVAFGSMWILLSRHVIKPTRGNMIYIATGSLYFALLPYWPAGGLSIPIMPLVTYSLLNIRASNSSYKDWVILLLVPLYSSFVIIYFFYLLAAGLYWVIDSIQKKDWQWHFIGAIIFMGLIYLGIEYRLIYSTFFDSGFVSHRTEFVALFSKNGIQSYREAYNVFLNGHNLTKGNHYLFLLPLALVALLISLKPLRCSRYQSLIIVLMLLLGYTFDIWHIIFASKYFFPFAALVLIWFIAKRKYFDARLAQVSLLLILISLWSGFWYYKGWSEIKAYIPLIEMFNMSRFLFLQPFLWGLMAVLSVMILGKKMHYSAFVIMAFWSAFGFIAINNATFRYPKSHEDTFRKYYASDLFDQLDSYIGKSKESYRIMSLGIDPAVSLYNGFYTVDGYSVNYPLEYKHRFKQIISKELLKNNYNNFLFNQWGSKCYLLTRAVLYNSQNYPNNFANLELDTRAMYEMGARYLIAPAKIPNPQKGLKYLKSFNNSGGYRTLYLYEIKLLR